MRIRDFLRDTCGSMNIKAKHVAGAAAVSLALPAAVVNYTFPHLTVSEGLALVSYYDPVGVLTDCLGNTKNVHVGEHKTREQCLQETADRLPDYWIPMVKASPVMGTDLVPVSFKSAWLQFTWNEGTGIFGRYIAPQINGIVSVAGWDNADLRPACDHMFSFTRAGSNPTMLLSRRKREHADCVEEL